MNVNPSPSMINPYYPMFKYRRITPLSIDSIYLLLSFKKNSLKATKDQKVSKGREAGKWRQSVPGRGLLLREC